MPESADEAQLAPVGAVANAADAAAGPDRKRRRIVEEAATRAASASDEKAAPADDAQKAKEKEKEKKGKAVSAHGRKNKDLVAKAESALREGEESLRTTFPEVASAQVLEVASAQRSLHIAMKCQEVAQAPGSCFRFLPVRTQMVHVFRKEREDDTADSSEDLRSRQSGATLMPRRRSTESCTATRGVFS